MIEITRDDLYVYRLDPDDSRQIQYKENKHRARWQHLVQCRDEQDARKSLLTGQHPEYQTADDS